LDFAISSGIIGVILVAFALQWVWSRKVRCDNLCVQAQSNMLVGPMVGAPQASIATNQSAVVAHTTAETCHY